MTSALPVNFPSLLDKHNAGPEDEFFYRFFVKRARRGYVNGILRYKEQRRSSDQEDGDAERVVLDAAEEGEVDHDFSRYGQQWDSDEEAFVDSLAQKLIGDSFHVHGPDI